MDQLYIEQRHTDIYNKLVKCISTYDQPAANVLIREVASIDYFTAAQRKVLVDLWNQVLPAPAGNGIGISISNEQLQAGFQAHLDKLMMPGEYNNPIKNAMDHLFGYSGSMKGVIGAWVEENMKTVMASAQFQLALGQAMAQEIARREVDKLKK